MTVTPALSQACAPHTNLAARALTTQLEHLRALYHLRCLVLCDSDGHMLASAGFPEEAALLVAHLTTRAPLNTPELREDRLATCALFLDGTRLTLAAMGIACAPSPECLSRAVRAARRSAHRAS